VKIRGKNNNFTDFETLIKHKEAIRRMYIDDKLSLNKIALMLNTSPNAIKKIIEQTGCKIISRLDSLRIQAGKK
jgi:predicted DNA-binding protein YlxM (UPF0122 family)